MKKITNNIVFSLIFSLLISFPIMAEPTISFNESRVMIGKGDVHTLDVLMEDFPLSEGGGISLTYNPSIIQIDDININSELWSFVNMPGSIDNENGKVTGFIFSSYKGVSGNSRIATVTISGLKNGTTRLVLQGSRLNPFSSDGKIINVNFNRSLIRVKR